MKKLYFAFFMIVSGFFTQTSMAQLVANDDVANVNGSGFAMVGPNYFNVRTNDTYNGNPFAAGFVNMTQLSTTSPNVNVSGGNIYVQPGTPAGTYTIVYQICLTSNPGVCDTATVTVNVCFVATPVVQTPTCQTSSNSLSVTGLPATGTWTLTQKFNSSIISTFTGSGTFYYAADLVPGGYQYSVTDATGCTSAFSNMVYLGYLNGLTGNMTGTYVDFNSNGIIEIGDKITYQISISNTLACDMTNVHSSQTGQLGLTVNGGGFSIAAFATNSSSMTATYQLTQDDINMGSVTNWIGIEGTSNGFSNYTKVFTTTDLSIPSGIRLNAFYDTNGNGIQDVGEAYFDQGFFTYEINNNGQTHYLYSAYTGEVTLYETNPANTYDINLVLSGTECASQYSIPATVFNDINVPDNSGITTYNFPITVVPCTDLGIHLFSYNGNPRPGLTYSQAIYYHNYGNQPIASGTITFNHDPAVTITDTSETVTPTATGFTCTFSNLLPGDTMYIIVEMQVPSLPTVALGQWLTSTASITVPSGDSNPNNHDSVLSQMISGSYDPNDKLENHGPRILFSTFDSDDYLTYTIRFENTGTANADKVVITDVLDNKLDPASIRYVDSSHLFAMDFVGNNLTLTFNGINLPPSVTDTMIGKGFFIFTVKPKPGYAVGDIISNTANIVFDTNPAIVTNTVTTEFVATLAAPQFALDDIKVYPNPAKSLVNISLNSGTIERIAITDVSGKLVQTETPHTMDAAINISALAKGLYFVKITAADKEKTVKIIKE